MKNFTKKVTAMTLCLAFTSMQYVGAAGLSDASINSTSGGYVNSVTGTNSLDLNFNGNSHVNWNKLNVGSGETLNFNAVNGANGLTILNTVNSGMSTFAGTVNANDGIAKLIISNPNGMLFDGSQFTTAGDLMLTTQAMGANFVGNNMEVTKLNQAALKGITIQNSDFTVGGEFNIMAPTINALQSAIKAGQGLKLITANGQDYLVAPGSGVTIANKGMRLETVSIDGNVLVVSGEDLVNFVNGGEIIGNLDIDSKGVVAINYQNDANKTFKVTGNLNANSTGALNPSNKGNFMLMRNAEVGGNVQMSNSGGFLQVANLKANGDVDLKTTDGANTHVKHFIHVIGDNDIKGNLKVDSIHNVHIGGYDSELTQLENGSLKVSKNIDVTAQQGSVAVTVDTTADKVSLTSGTLNIISNGTAKIKANEYNFKAKGYIGGLDSEQKIIQSMENYTLIPPETKTYLNIDGGKVTKLETDNNGFAFLRSSNDMEVTGVNAGKVMLSSGKDIKISGPNTAELIQVDGETRNLTVETPANSRNYTLKYTNIKDSDIVTVNPSTEITYEMANGDNGWNKGTQTANNTYLVVAGQPTPPPVDPPVNPPNNPPINPDDNENVKILKNLNRDRTTDAIAANPVYTPVAFAADMEDQVNSDIRKNVDGSVTVVRAFMAE